MKSNKNLTLMNLKATLVNVKKELLYCIFEEEDNKTAVELSKAHKNCQDLIKQIENIIK